MRTFGNIIWHIFFLGFLNSFIVFLIGGLLYITVIGAPLGQGLIQLSKFLLAPFTREMVKKKEVDIKQNKVLKAYGIIVTIVYFPLGIIIALIEIVSICLLFVSIIGIPGGIAIAKSLSTIINPVNKVCMTSAKANILKTEKAKKDIEKRKQK